MNAPVLRDYQARAVTEIQKQIAMGGKSRLCLVAPTGAGKTVMAGALVQAFVGMGLRVLFLAHRIELVNQAIRRLGVPCGVIAAGTSTSHSLFPCVVGMVQTVRRRPIEGFDVIIVDEAHHIMAAGYQAVLSKLPEAIVVGLTATPTRLDGKGLGDVFESLVPAATVSSLIEEGSLVRPLVYTTPAPPDMSSVHTRAGEYVESEVEAAVNTSTLRGDVVRHWLERCPGRPTAMFAVSVKHSLDLCQEFAAAGVRAVHVDGKMPQGARDAAIAAVCTGEAKVLSNVGIVTEGWDFPALEVCILARPTKSVSLLLQMWGRVMRPHPGKTQAIVLDHAGNVHEHKILPWVDIEWTLEESRPTVPKELAVKNCPRCFAVLVSSARVCPCGHSFSDHAGAGAALPDIDRDAELVEADESLLVAKVKSSLAKRAKPSRYLEELADKLARGELAPEFVAYVERSRGALGSAVHRYVEDTGRWPQ